MMNLREFRQGRALPYFGFMKNYQIRLSEERGSLRVLVGGSELQETHAARRDVRAAEQKYEMVKL